VSLALEPVPGVVSLRYEVSPVDCASGASLGPVETQEVSLLDFAAPPVDADPTFEDDSQHPFSDAYFTLAPGCYDVSVTPLDDAGTASATCAPAQQEKVEVFADQTTEIVLVSQCEGRDMGGLDGVSVLNRPPTIESVAFEPSRYVRCGDVERICAEVSDEDHDPLELVFQSSTSNPASLTPTLSVDEANGETLRQCVDVTPTKAGAYTLNLTAYDLAYLGGQRARIEDILSTQAQPLPSHTTTEIVFYATDCQPSSQLSGSVQYSSHWGAGYCAVITVKNGGTTTTTNWTTTLALQNSAITAGSPYNATFTVSGAQITAKSMSYNGTLAPGASTTFGFCGTATGQSAGVSVVSVQ
jgi:cellulase/cellobiase CelA1